MKIRIDRRRISARLCTCKIHVSKTKNTSMKYDRMPYGN